MNRSSNVKKSGVVVADELVDDDDDLAIGEVVVIELVVSVLVIGGVVIGEVVIGEVVVRELVVGELVEDKLVDDDLTDNKEAIEELVADVFDELVDDDSVDVLDREELSASSSIGSWLFLCLFFLLVYFSRLSAISEFDDDSFLLCSRKQARVLVLIAKCISGWLS